MESDLTIGPTRRDHRTLVTVLELFRYPVKSLGGEPIPVTAVDARGLAGDRQYAVRDRSGKLGSGKTTRRFRRLPGLMTLTGRTRPGGVVVVTEDGREFPVESAALDRVVSDRYGERLTISPEQAVSHFDRGAVHVLTTASLRWLGHALGEVPDRRRFRPNVVIEVGGDALVEQAWIGMTLRIGSALLRISESTERCAMVESAQHDFGERRGILRYLTTANAQRFGVYAEVIEPGLIRLGDRITLDAAAR
jgi:hypothetical protein